MTKWIATNIRFPEDMYMELKMEAAKQRKSVAEVVRKRVSTKAPVEIKSRTRSIVAEMKKLAKDNAKYMKGVNLTKALIKMRYEQ